MAEAVDRARHEFWRPPLAASEAVANTAANGDRSATCPCGSEFIVSSLYCHSCGTRRVGLNAPRTLEIPGWSELVSLGALLGLTVPAAISLLAGVFCLVGALAVSVFFPAQTALDWQAIQMWRIEWLLAAIAAFVVGCLLKK